VAIGSSQLAIRVSGNQIVVSWPTNMTGFTLQYAATPNTPGSWQPYPTGPSMSGNQYIVTEPLAAGPRFYRLKK